MYKIKVINNHGFGERVTIGAPINIKRAKIVEHIPDEPTEFMKRRKAAYERPKRKRSNKGQLIDMNSLLD